MDSVTFKRFYSDLERAISDAFSKLDDVSLEATYLESAADELAALESKVEELERDVQQLEARIKELEQDS